MALPLRISPGSSARILLLSQFVSCVKMEKNFLVGGAYEIYEMARLWE